MKCVAIAVVGLAAATTLPAQGRVWLPHDGHWYSRTSTPGAWWEHTAEAQAYGGYMVSVQDAGENAWLCQSFAQDVSNLWLGGIKMGGAWTWVSGDPWTYSNWWPGEPNGSGDYLQMYGALDPGGRSCYWDDTGASQWFYSVIEIPAGLLCDAPSPGIAGGVNAVSFYGATPGQHVYLVCGFTSGSTPVPSCPGAVVGMLNPAVAGRVLADPNGSGTFSGRVPLGAAGVTALIQAVEPASCRVSNLVTWTFL